MVLEDLELIRKECWSSSTVRVSLIWPSIPPLTSSHIKFVPQSVYYHRKNVSRICSSIAQILNQNPRSSLQSLQLELFLCLPGTHLRILSQYFNACSSIERGQSLHQMVIHTQLVTFGYACPTTSQTIAVKSEQAIQQQKVVVLENFLCWSSSSTLPGCVSLTYKGYIPVKLMH